MGELEDRFLDKVNKVNRFSGCWLWVAATGKDGYGRFSVNGRMELAHRIAYNLYVGPIPEGLELDHACRNHACVNPNHLETITHLENVRRGNARDTHNNLKTHCPQEHEYTPENTYLWNGRRACRTCRLDAGKRWRVASNRG